MTSNWTYPLLLPVLWVSNKNYYTVYSTRRTALT